MGVTGCEEGVGPGHVTESYVRLQREAVPGALKESVDVAESDAQCQCARCW